MNVEFFVKIKKKGVRIGGVSGWGGQGGCEQRSEVVEKIKKMGGHVGKGSGSGGVGVRVDVKEELKFL